MSAKEAGHGTLHSIPRALSMISGTQTQWIFLLVGFMWLTLYSSSKLCTVLMEASLGARMDARRKYGPRPFHCQPEVPPRGTPPRAISGLRHDAGEGAGDRRRLAPRSEERRVGRECR